MALNELGIHYDKTNRNYVLYKSVYFHVFSTAHISSYSMILTEYDLKKLKEYISKMEKEGWK